MCVPYFPDYKSRFFSCHGVESTYTPVRPMCRQIHGNHWATDCIPVGSIDGTEPCVMRAQHRPNHQCMVGGFDLCRTATGCVLTGPMFWVAVAAVPLEYRAK